MIDNCADDWRIAMTWQRLMQVKLVFRFSKKKKFVRRRKCKKDLNVFSYSAYTTLIMFLFLTNVLLLI